MKREQFLITSTEGHNIIKHKWNSARREVQLLIQDFVNRHSDQVVQYELVQEESEKDTSGFYHVSGVMKWKEKMSGKEISFFITKIA